MTVSYAIANKTSATRNGSVDLLRFAGAIGIVQFHCAAPGGWIGLSALPMFVILLVYYGAQKAGFLGAWKLLKIWLAWSAIYASFKIAQCIVSGTPLSSEFETWMLFTGPSIHLWFLPFSALFLVVTVFSRPMGNTALVVLCVAGSVLSLTFVRVATPIPLAQWVGVVPAALTGLYMARAERPELPALILSFASLAATLLGVEGLTEQHAIAGISVAAAITFPLPQTKLSDTLSSLSLGIYLIHPAVIALMLYVLPKSNPAFFPLVAAASVLLTLVIKVGRSLFRILGKKCIKQR
ncbi:peptidoglycan/LPS O-acetylase OafA/YrhL [Labrenzia sp. EL_208]|nr:peptidoglycan/LPS O-acetylase OafA/YrhL [Labrenzia sp. EL_132]MBG6230827.1 peptidoglycan/LPS O-acetylase OafA/YrhL [Labrenzia sp. EL_208]